MTVYVVTYSVAVEADNPDEAIQLAGDGGHWEAAPPGERFRVGDLDPTPEYPDGDLCSELVPNGVYECTWPKRHPHAQHVAGDSERVVAVWVEGG